MEHLCHKKKVQSAEQEEPLKVTLLKVGKADAIVIQTSKENMVIDTGRGGGLRKKKL